MRGTTIFEDDDGETFAVAHATFGGGINAAYSDGVLGFGAGIAVSDLGDDCFLVEEEE